MHTASSLWGVCVCVCVCVCVTAQCARSIAQPCPTLYDPLDCSLSGYAVHGIFQARRRGLPFPSPGIFPAQGSNPHLLPWQVDSLPPSHLESVAYLTKDQTWAPLHQEPRVLATRPQGRPIPHFLQVALDVMALRLC